MPVVRTLHVPTMVDAFLTELETMLLPMRTDSLYLRSVPVAAGDNTGLLPLPLFLTFGDRGRSARNAGLSFGGMMTVSVDVESGRICPIRPHLALPPDARSRLARIGPATGAPDRKAIAGPTDVAAVYTTRPGLPGPAGLDPVSRASTLYRMAPSILNLEAIGAASFYALGRMLARSRCYAVGPVADLPSLFAALASGLNGRVATDGRGVGSA